MPTQKKIDDVAEIKSRIEKNEIAIMTRYVGINVEQVTNLRKELRDAGVEYKVYKNTLAQRALEDLGIQVGDEWLGAPTAWAFSKDPVTPAKILRDWSGKVKFVSMTGGVLNGKGVTPTQLDALASLPSREQLIAQVVGTIAAPLRNFMGAVSGVPRNLVNVLEAIRKQKEEGGAAA